MDALVAEGAIEVVVPLLSLFQPAEPSYREYVVTRCGRSPDRRPTCWPRQQRITLGEPGTRYVTRSIAQPTFWAERCRGSQEDRSSPRG